jgi:hypothetical protein
MDMVLPRRMRERELPRGRMRRVVEAGLKAVERQLGEELFAGMIQVSEWKRERVSE